MFHYTMFFLLAFYYEREAITCQYKFEVDDRVISSAELIVWQQTIGMAMLRAFMLQPWIPSIFTSILRTHRHIV